MNFDFTRANMRGWLMHFLGRHELAAEAYARAFQANPKSADAARHVAAIAAERKDLATSEKWFEIALQLEPDDASSWFNLGFVRDAAGKKHEAIAAFKESVARLPALDLAWYGMGLAYAAIGNHAEAAGALSEAVRLQPMNGIGYYQLGMAYHYLHDAENVEKIIRRLVSFDPKYAECLMRDAQRANLMHLLPKPLR
jgi:tetratricopeptide (TPR) repeat protein